MNKVIIGGPVRNRAWILPEYLAALSRITYPNKRFVFLENDSTDETLQILRAFDEGVTFSIRPGVKHWSRGEYGTNNYEHLAKVRNEFVELFLETDGNYLLSIDSDIIVSSDIVDRLTDYADEKTIVGAGISNIPGRPLDGSTPGNFMISQGGVIIHPPVYRLGVTMDVAVVGAVYMIPRKALEDGVRYGPHPQGEDVYFCQEAQRRGYSLKVCLDIPCEHRMIQPDEPEV